MRERYQGRAESNTTAPRTMTAEESHRTQEWMALRSEFRDFAQRVADAFDGKRDRAPVRDEAERWRL